MTTNKGREDVVMTAILQHLSVTVLSKDTSMPLFSVRFHALFKSVCVFHFYIPKNVKVEPSRIVLLRFLTDSKDFSLHHLQQHPEMFMYYTAHLSSQKWMSSTINIQYH